MNDNDPNSRREDTNRTNNEHAVVADSFSDRALLAMMEGIGEITDVAARLRAAVASFVAMVAVLAAPASAQTARNMDEIDPALLTNINYVFLQSDPCSSTVGELLVWLQEWALIVGLTGMAIVGVVAAVLLASGTKKASGMSMVGGILIGVIAYFVIVNIIDGAAAIAGVERCGVSA